MGALDATTIAMAVEMAGLMARKTGAAVLRVDMFIHSKSQLVFGELTFTPMVCLSKFTPVIFDTVLGAAIHNPRIESDSLAVLASHLVCGNDSGNNPSPYLVGCDRDAPAVRSRPAHCTVLTELPNWQCQ